MMFDGAEFGGQIVDIVKAYVERTVAPLLARISELEQRQPTLSDEQRAEVVAAVAAAIPVPRDGKDVDPAEIEAMVARAAAALPAPKDGDPGRDADPAEVARLVAEAVAALPAPRDGKDADPAVIEDMVQRAVAALPPARNGQDADPAVIERMVSDAISALPVPRDGKDIDPSAIEQMVARAVAAIPAPRDGKDVEPADVARMVADAVKALPAPKDGVGLAGATIDRAGGLIITLSDGTMRELGPVVGRDVDMAAVERIVRDAVSAIPAPKDGADGLGFDDLALEQVSEREIVLRFTRGDRIKSLPLRFPAILDRGVFKAGSDYEQGDAVTWGGSLWIAQRDTSDKPGDGDGWRLAVKKGRDAKEVAHVG